MSFITSIFHNLSLKYQFSLGQKFKNNLVNVSEFFIHKITLLTFTEGYIYREWKREVVNKKEYK